MSFQFQKIGDATYFITPGGDHNSKADGGLLDFLQEQLRTWRKSKKADTSIPVSGDVLLLLLEKIQDLTDRVTALENGAGKTAVKTDVNAPAGKSMSTWESLPAFRGR